VLVRLSAAQGREGASTFAGANFALRRPNEHAKARSVMASFTQLPVSGVSSLLDSRPCCAQRCFQRRAGAGTGSLWRPFQTPCKLAATHTKHGSVRKHTAVSCQAVSAPPNTVSKTENGTGGHTATFTDYPIANKKEQKGPKILIAGAGIGGLVLAVGLLKRGFDVKVFEKNITAIRGEGKYRGPIQVRMILLYWMIHTAPGSLDTAVLTLFFDASGPEQCACCS